MKDLEKNTRKRKDPEEKQLISIKEIAELLEIAFQAGVEVTNNEVYGKDPICSTYRDYVVYKNELQLKKLKKEERKTRGVK